MGAFRDNDKDRNRDPNNMRSGSTGSDNSAPDNDNAGTAKGNGGNGFEYPGLSNSNTGSDTPDISGDGSGASDNFEYGDDSVAGEYDVRESPVFNYGGGSIPETDGEGHTYNTCYVFDRQGRQIGKHRKVHLFDIYAHGEQVFKESDTLTGGDSFNVFDTEWCKMAVNICFDIRFPESSRLPAIAGAKVIFNPASFNMTTGPAHWELGFRQRAIENQIYMVGTADAQDPSAGYVSYGHSIITDPWGNVIMQMDEKPGVEVTEIDLDYIDTVRAKLPLMSARRTDVYELKSL